MSTKNETGHAINVANFEILVSHCLTLGTQYNPSRTNIKIAAMQQLLIDSRAALQTINNKKTAADNAIDARRQLYTPIKPLATRLVAALQATNASSETIANAKSINKKIQGTRVVKIEPNADGTMPKTRSTSQQSFVQTAEHFDRLVSLLEQESSYTPNEAELQAATLRNLHTNLITSTTNVVNTTRDLTQARITRDETLYKEDTGLHTVALDVKNYLKSILGTSNLNYKAISSLKIVKIKTA